MAGKDREPPEEYRVPPHQLITWLVLGLAVLLVAGLVGVRLEHQPETTRDYPPRPQMADGPNVLLAAPEVDDEYMPCDDCHQPNDGRTDTTVRELEDDHYDMEFAHGNLWCLHCHNPEQRESLHLADGSLVDFEDSWQLCTQCHAKKLADWRAGVHGKRTGHWRGPREYRTCVVCHDPHLPPFKALEPKPAPKRPEEIVRKGGAGHEDS